MFGNRGTYPHVLLDCICSLFATPFPFQFQALMQHFIDQLGEEKKITVQENIHLCIGSPEKLLRWYYLIKS